MATTVTSSTLTYSLTESCELAGSQRGSSFKRTVSDSVVEYSRMVRNLQATAGFMTIASFSTTPLSSGSSFDIDEVKYIRITNLDDAVSVYLAINAEFAYSTTLTLSPGMTFMFGSPKDAYAETEGVPGRDIQSLKVRVPSGSVDIEVVVGSL